jgi:hypothetical protein
VLPDPAFEDVTKRKEFIEDGAHETQVIGLSAYKSCFSVGG